MRPELANYRLLNTDYSPSMYGVFPQYAIGFDTVITKTYNVR